MSVATPEPGDEGDEELRRKIAEENARARHPHNMGIFKGHESLDEPVDVPDQLRTDIDQLLRDAAAAVREETDD